MIIRESIYWLIKPWNGKNYSRVYDIAMLAAIALGMMFVGAMGKSAVSPDHFGIVERFSVFAAVGFEAVLGIYLFRGFPKKESDMKAPAA